MDSRRAIIWLLLAFFCWSCSARPGGRDAAPALLDGSDQALLVLAGDWNATQGNLQAFERSWTGAWKPVGGDVPVQMGRNGLGWGLGLHPEQDGGPRKGEGDGRAPAGVFSLGPAFGPAPLSPPNPAFPFQVMGPNSLCVDDEVSSYYNLLLESDAVPARNWDSAETMLRPDGLYELGLVVGHNPPPARPGAGSCIFLHLSRTPPAPGAGCTAMARPDLERLLRWLRADKRPVLVQLPRGVYERLKPVWGLP